MNLPAISCKCITYGRINFLEESVYSFLQQNYAGKKELVIVNDYPLQNIKFDHPDIKIINLDYTFNTIGDKENFAVNNCNYDIIAVWDDDDIAMPNHLQNIAKYWQKNTDLLQWHRGVYYNEPNTIEITGLGNSGIVYSRHIWETVGRHTQENAGYDMSFVIKIKNHSNNIIYADPPDTEVSWFYMWGGRGYHMSGQGTDTPNRPNIIERHSDHIDLLKKQGLIPVGDIYLEPQWHKNYYQLLQKYCQANPKIL